ncbi:MAG: tetratricopeptide repeat protein, partial [Thermodesulfobacteriota bacterium]|nr:tetratricopeptide repeat protein [Thermodesulfobacteriota bacterium]
MNHTKWISSFIFSGCLLVVLMGSKPAAATDCEQWVARAVSVQGNVQVQRVGVSTWENIKLEDRFCSGDMIRILEKSRAALVLRNESVIRLDENTTITVKAEEKSRSLLLRLIKGAVHFFSRVPRSLKVATPFVNCAVEATEFFVRVEESRTYFSVFRGRVRTYNDSGELLLAGGQTAITTKDQAPSMITIARPRDAVNWSLYYPSIGITEGPGTQKDLFSASQSLQTGQVTEAQDLLTRMLNEDPGNSDALALNAIIALTLHRKEDARALAEKAVASNPKSSPAKLARAYVQQAFFNVEDARGTMQSAAADNPENAFVWARLSELWLATGYLDKALSAAKKAAALSPDISRTQTVLGYAYISQIKIKKAKEVFHKAIALDQADPLPRLGLGLALIRGGDLKAGRAQIEIAAGLAPGNALIRSYLGKAFYEEKKNDLAARQYAVAKELDPNDPTPYFYDAIRKQSVNRPVEALHGLQKSIELNDNRAVYRSRLLLD